MRILSLWPIYATLALVLGSSSCGGMREAGSPLKRHATANNREVRVYRVKDGASTGYALVNGIKRFELNCEDPLEKATLISATGFPPISITDISFDTLASTFAAGPVLSCHAGDRTLYKAELDGQTKYFFGPNKTATDLYMIGCQALVEGMGFDLRTARVLDPYFIDNGIFTVPDSNDISCYQGANVGARQVWELYQENIRDVVSDSALDSIIYRVRRPNGLLAALTFKKEGSCDWLKVDAVDPLLIVSGRVPAAYAGKSCLLTVTADAGTPGEEQKTLLLRERIKPLVTSTCPATIDVYTQMDFPDCTIATTIGEITLTPPITADCAGVFDYSAVQKKVLLLKTPSDSVECTATFQAKQDDMISLPLSIRIVKKSSIFIVPISENKACESICSGRGFSCIDGRFFHPYCAGGMCTAFYSTLSCTSTAWWGTNTYECRCRTPQGNVPNYPAS